MSYQKPSWAEAMAVALILSSLALLACFPRLNPRLRAPGDDAAAYVAQSRPEGVSARPGKPRIPSAGTPRHRDAVLSRELEDAIAASID